MTKLLPNNVRQFIHFLTDGDLASAELILEEDPEVLDARVANEATVLQFFTNEASLEAINFLVQHGAKVDVKNKFGATALIDAATMGDCEICEILLEYGANVNLAAASFDTPLICAVRSGCPDVVELLLKHGADATYRSPFGRTIFDVVPKQSHTRFAVFKVLERYADQSIQRLTHSDD